MNGEDSITALTVFIMENMALVVFTMQAKQVWNSERRLGKSRAVSLALESTLMQSVY